MSGPAWVGLRPWASRRARARRGTKLQPDPVDSESLLANEFGRVCRGALRERVSDLAPGAVFRIEASGFTMKRRGRLLPFLVAIPLILWLVSGIAPHRPSEHVKARSETGLDTRRWIEQFLRTKRWPTAPPSASQAGIGGPFALVDQHGRRVSDADFRGGFMLVYFGYSSCPDVCPLELQVMVDAVERLGREGYGGRPVFITVDPERDTVARLADYAGRFGPSLVALTGEPREIGRVAESYGVSFTNACEEPSRADCLIDHSSQLYLMGPEGASLARFEAGQAPEAIARKVRERLKAPPPLSQQ